MEEIKQKIEELELALNYVCYDATLIPKLQNVWNKLTELQEMVNKTCNKPAVSGALPCDAPDEIWVNVYNPIKPNSWDIHDSEKHAVMNSIGAKTHRYIHERLLGNDR